MYSDHLPAAVVLGLGQNGLATVRSLGRQGIPVIGIDRNLRQYTARTRYCRRLLCTDFKSGEGLVDLLVDLGKRLPRRGVLFPSGDFSLELVSEKRERLAPYYHFSFPQKEIVRLTLNKRQFYTFAALKNFPIPQTFFPQSMDEWRGIADQVRYPCIVKPFQPNLGWRKLFPDQKLFTAQSREDLLRMQDRLIPLHKDLIVQERIPGRDDRLSFSLTYLDETSQPLGIFTGRKLRQYPPDFGTSSMAQSLWDPWIASKSIEILQAMKFTGYGSVEFRLDLRDNAYKIIEVTARTWFPHGISTACGQNLTYLAYCHLVGLPLPELDEPRSPVKWIHEERDLRSSIDYLRAGRMTVREWLSSYRGKKTFAISARDDPAPALHLLAQMLSVPWRRMLKG
ncbi:hypothetical protein [Desulfatiglans anilini]|uniref:carboxylate--amine ligase n=1 Tax=Desulfatiglans anilini TaxID=90728 RepID=UPI0003F9F90B|nr:hypothetical protein [Desulfatiglans anilini]